VSESWGTFGQSSVDQRPPVEVLQPCAAHPSPIRSGGQASEARKRVVDQVWLLPRAGHAWAWTKGDTVDRLSNRGDGRAKRCAAAGAGRELGEMCGHQLAAGMLEVYPGLDSRATGASSHSSQSPKPATVARN
jgi:hypothetical protein